MKENTYNLRRSIREIVFVGLFNRASGVKRWVCSSRNVLRSG